MQIECPLCQTLLEISEPTDGQITCPTCGGQISLEVDEPEIDAGEHLDSLRIRQLSAARRAANRMRSYCIIATMFCAVAAGQFVWNALRRDSTSWTIAYVLLAVVSVWGAIYFVRRARDIRKEL